MIEQLQKRLSELKQEYANGEAKLERLNTETAQLRETMLRISGAIQVLEEEISKPEANAPKANERLKASA